MKTYSHYRYVVVGDKTGFWKHVMISIFLENIKKEKPGLYRNIDFELNAKNVLAIPLATDRHQEISGDSYMGGRGN